jgi:hypothetical protein
MYDRELVLVLFRVQDIFWNQQTYLSFSRRSLLYRPQLGESYLKIGILSDGKYGDRAYENISRRFPSEWILVESPESEMIDDIKLDVPSCDLYISYLRHPDIVLALVEKKVPTILGVSFGIGFLKQAREVYEHVIAPPTMCSLEGNSGVKEFDEYAKFFGRPRFRVQMSDGTISDLEVLRESPCGSTRGAATNLVGVPLSIEMLRSFGLRVTQYCRAPRFGRTCDKEFSAILHTRQLIESIKESSGSSWDRINDYEGEVQKMYEEKVNLLSR